MTNNDQHDDKAAVMAAFKMAGHGHGVRSCNGHHFDGGVGDNYRFCFKKVFSFFRMNDGELPRDWTL